MSSNSLITESGQSQTIYPVFEADFDAWLTGQPDDVQSWLKSTGFKPTPSAFSWLPGTPTQLVTIIDPNRLLEGLAELPAKLPPGDYRLAAHLETRQAAALALGWGLGAYRFDTYKSHTQTLIEPAPGPTIQPSEPGTPEQPAPARLLLPDACDAEFLSNQLDAIRLTRDLINTPASDMLPSQLAAEARAVAEIFGADIDVIEGDALLQKGLNAIHSVGRASADAPRLIDLNWGNAAHPRVTLVGKGVCFDSGGLDLKPAAGMRLMKKDMGGSAHVLGLAHLIMAQRLPVRLRVLIPAVENAVSGNAYRPGDIIRTYKGLTVEIDNTDAEGRLVLCDALALASEDNPALLVDFATLTGAARVALGTEVPAMFCNDDQVAQGLQSAASEVHDPLWRLPLHQNYRSLLDSRFADLVNSAQGGYGGAITAGLFLEAFVEKTVPWVHFDVMAWNLSSKPAHPEGGEAMGLRALYHYLDASYGRH